MSDKFTPEKPVYDVRLLGEVANAAARHGGTSADLKSLASGDMFAKILPVLRGHAEVAMIKHIIDLNADPYVPDGWNILEHHSMEEFEFDPQRIKLYLSPEQEGGRWIEGKMLQKELEGKHPFNANLLDYLLAHPQLIPEKWKGKATFFWGTIYRYSDGSPYVRYLAWNGDEWHWDWDWLGSDAFSSGYPAVCLAS